jgi:hypothetical protein
MTRILNIITGSNGGRLRAVAITQHRGEIGPENLKIDCFQKRLEVIAKVAQALQTLVNKNPECPAHRFVSDPARRMESETQPKGEFLEASSWWSKAEQHSDERQRQGDGLAAFPRGRPQSRYSILILRSAAWRIVSHEFALGFNRR